MVGRWDGGQWGNGEVSVQSMGEKGKYFCPKFLQPLLESSDRVVTTEAGSFIQYFTTPTALLDSFEHEGGKTSSDQYPKGP